MTYKETFIERAIIKHGNVYDYSKVDYKRSDEKVIITCKNHGDFIQLPKAHLQGKGCKLCFHERHSKNFTKSTENFIENAIKKHGDTYDYSEVKYIKYCEKVEIICRKHGKFLQMPSSHLSGNGCKTCAIENNTVSQEDFIENAKKIHGNYYDYSRCNYKRSFEKVIIICKKHGEFSQVPSSHLNGHGCYDCGNEKNSINLRSNEKEFIEKAEIIHGDCYDYSRCNYIRSSEKVIIICKKHGEFSQEPNSHLNGSGCSYCGGDKISKNLRSNKKEFLEKAIKIHGDKYDYSSVEYTTSNKKIKIKCNYHGIFLQGAGSHLSGSGCPFCVNKTEGKLFEKISEIYPTITSQFKQEWCRNIHCLPYDFCIPEKKIIIELDGKQHFKQVRNWIPPENQYLSDKFKEKCANENGYSTIRILQEDVFFDRYDWIAELCQSIDNISNSGNITNIYLCKNGEYDLYL